MSKTTNNFSPEVRSQPSSDRGTDQQFRKPRFSDVSDLLPHQLSCPESRVQNRRLPASETHFQEGTRWEPSEAM